MQFGGMILPVTGGFWTVEGLVSGGFFHRLEVFARWDAVWWDDSSSEWGNLPVESRFCVRTVPVAGDFGRKSNEIGRHCAERGISRAHYMPYGKLKVSVFQA